MADDLDALNLRDATLMGFSMGGGEAALRQLTRQDRLLSVALAAAVTPYLMNGSDNPDGC